MVINRASLSSLITELYHTQDIDYFSFYQNNMIRTVSRITMKNLSLFIHNENIQNNYSKIWNTEMTLHKANNQ